jgi:hypothetical protein
MGPTLGWSPADSPACYTGTIQPPDDDPESGAPSGEEPDEPTTVAQDGMAPLINNTGADGTEDEGADASSG